MRALTPPLNGERCPCATRPARQRNRQGGRVVRRTERAVAERLRHFDAALEDLRRTLLFPDDDAGDGGEARPQPASPTARARRRRRRIRPDPGPVRPPSSVCGRRVALNPAPKGGPAFRFPLRA